MSSSRPSARRPAASVITAHRGRPDLLERLRACLAAQSFGSGNFEWIPVDDASPGGPPAWMTGDGVDEPWIRPIIAKKHRGRAGARNMALKKARGGVIALVDADMEPNPVWLEMLVRGVRETGAVIVGRWYPHPALPRTAFLEYLHSRGAAKCEPGCAIPGKYFTSANSALPRSWLEQCGGFDERFRGWGGEDLELGLRLEEMGARFLYEPRAWAWHLHQRSWADIERNYLRYGREVVPELLRRYPEAERLLSLDALRPPCEKCGPGEAFRRATVQLLNRGELYGLFRFLTNLAPRFPWPDMVFDFMLFYLYSRHFSEAGVSEDD